MTGVVGLTGAKVQRRSGAVPLDNLPALNVHVLQEAGVLSPGAVALLSWPGLSGTLRAEQGRLLIEIEGEAAQVIGVTGIAMRLGGEGPAFLCPRCGRRKYDLYVADDRRLLCRACGRWDHASRHELRDDVVRMAGRLRRRLGGSGLLLAALPPRPRGLAAAREYDRIAEQIARYEVKALARLRAMCGSLEQFAERKK